MNQPIPVWGAQFHSFSVLHFVTASVLVGAIVAAACLGRVWRNTGRERVLRNSWAGFTIAFQFYSVVWWLLPAQFDLHQSLPIQLCDLAAWIAPFALLTQNRTLRALLFFWGIGLSTQAFVSPVVVKGPATTEFWLFWIGHTQIVGSAVYDLIVLRFRPRFRDLAVVVAITTLAAAIMLAFDLALNLNYWYIGRATPDSATILNALGPWPWRVLWMALLALVVLTLLWLIFWIADRRSPQR